MSSDESNTRSLVLLAAGGVAGLAYYLSCRSDSRKVKSSVESKGKSAKTSNPLQVARFQRVVSDLTSKLSSRQKKLRHLDNSFFEEEKKGRYTIESTKTLKLDRLSDYVLNLTWRLNKYQRSRSSKASARSYGSFTGDDEAVLFDIVRSVDKKAEAMAFRRAGAREKICWEAKDVSACIVTCGGLCPGLNVVINEIVEVLHYAYGVDKIWGVRAGYRGLLEREGGDFVKLTPKVTKGINTKGGTILFSSRGGLSPDSPDSELDKAFSTLEKKGINMMFIIGGDGTHRGAYRLYEYAKKMNKKFAIAGIPKTIDNDLGVIDSSFGFNTAVEEATKAIFSAVTEATCNKPNGVGIVKLMGRHAGYIACHATLASRQVDMCLINEDKFLEKNGPEGVSKYIEQTVAEKGHAVIVVAEGAGSDYLKVLHGEGKADASGNKALPSVSEFLIKVIKKHFKSRNKEVTIKYHDPSYMIRSVSANASDNVMCVLLAQNAVHGAMAGYTGFTSGIVNNRSVMIPMPVIIATSPSFLNARGRTWARVLAATQQPITKGLYE